MKLLVDINRNKKTWMYIDDVEFSDLVRRLSVKINGIRKIGFVVPMHELRETMKKFLAQLMGCPKR